MSLQIRDITSNTALPTTPITIVRPPVILVHGIWGDLTDWDNFSPLVSGPSTVDSRFSVGRFDYSDVIGAQISNPIPTYQTVASARQSSLGFQYNAQHLYVEVGFWIQKFKSGKNPANIAVAAVQADIVAHSMGGDVTRTMALSPTFLDDPIRPTFGQGSVHKLITIDTPHLGSPLGSKLLLSPTNDCTRGVLAGHGGYYSFTSVTLTGSGTSVCGTATNSVCGAVGDMSPSSPALNNINQPPQPQPYYFPTALIAGIYTNFASLDCQGVGTGCGAAKMRTKCTNDPLAQSLTSDGWPDNFGVPGSNKNDGLVPLSSQLNTSTANPASNLGFQFSGYAHSQGIEVLSFKPPSMLDQGIFAPNTISIPQKVIDLLNTPVTNQTVFALVNP